MKILYPITSIMGLTILFYSFSANPPDGFTGAPGNSICSNCHSLAGSPNQGLITVEGFPSQITPDQTYYLTVVNRNTNDGAVKAGFQMTILGPTNTRAGDMTSTSVNAIVSTSGGRQYFEHNPAAIYPDSNVVKWTVSWKAPLLASGSKITWYAAGIIANGNSNNSGDRTVIAKSSGTIVLAGTKDLASFKPKVYPNPGSDVINIQLTDESRPEGQIYFYDLSGRKAGETDIHQGIANTSFLPMGIYLLQICNGDRSYVVQWSKI